MRLTYLLPRLVRHFLPEKIVRFLLRKRLIIRPGLETSAPETAAAHYLDRLAARQVSIQGKRVLVLGYGGRFAVGCALLREGASEVLLVDPYAPPNHSANASLLPQFERYLARVDGRVIPIGSQLHVSTEDIRSLVHQIEKVDVALSNSVFEHLDDVEGITAALAQCTHSRGVQLHFVDLRDHYFRFPFEMLTFSEKIWKTWLNPTSNLNRLRVKDYRSIFKRYFEHVEMEVIQRDLPAWKKTLPRIRPEFLSGNADEDSVTLLQVILGKPK